MVTIGPSPLGVALTQSDASGGAPLGAQPLGQLQRFGTWCCLQSVPRARKKTSLTSAGSAAFSLLEPYRSRGIPSGPLWWWMLTRSRHVDPKCWRR